MIKHQNLGYFKKGLKKLYPNFQKNLIKFWH
jgi:hypothetical protein